MLRWAKIAKAVQGCLEYFYKIWAADNSRLSSWQEDGVDSSIHSVIHGLKGSPFVFLAQRGVQPCSDESASLPRTLVMWKAEWEEE